MLGIVFRPASWRTLDLHTFVCRDARCLESLLEHQLTSRGVTELSGSEGVSKDVVWSRLRRRSIAHR